MGPACRAGGTKLALCREPIKAHTANRDKLTGQLVYNPLHVSSLLISEVIRRYTYQCSQFDLFIY